MLAILAGCMLPLWGASCTRGGNNVASVDHMRAVEIPRTSGYCVTLYAGQTIDVGTVCAEVDDTVDTSAQCGAGATGALDVTYTTTDGWGLWAAHLAVGNGLGAIPTTNKGNPKAGLFPYSASGLGGIKSYAFTVPLCEIDPGLDGSSTSCGPVNAYVAAHAVVKEGSGGGYPEETAWGDGEPIRDHGNWATFFMVGLECKADGGQTTGGTGSTETTFDHERFGGDSADGTGDDGKVD